jgi:hypothetical protein
MRPPFLLVGVREALKGAIGKRRSAFVDKAFGLEVKIVAHYRKPEKSR